jgi:ribonuclease P protein component
VRTDGIAIGRIRSRDTFEAIRKSGVRGGYGPVRIRCVRQTSSSEAQFAYALGKKIGTAVVRNRLRRRLRAIVAEMGSHLAPGAYLVSAGPTATALKFDELRMVMGRALESVNGGPRMSTGGRDGSAR